MHIQRLFSNVTFAMARLINTPFFEWAKLKNKPYHLLVPAATYAPWVTDRDFLSAYYKVRPHSLVNLYQAWELWKMAEQLEQVPGDILEVGVWRGSTSIIMGKKLMMIRSAKLVYACDTFTGVVKAGDEQDNYYAGGEHKDTSLQFVAAHVKKFGLTNVHLLQGIFPDDTGHEVADRQFSMCHIDVDAYRSGRDVLDWVWPRLSVGGVVLFNDYGFPITKGITQLVNEENGRQGRVVIHNINGNGIIVKTEA